MGYTQHLGSHAGPLSFGSKAEPVNEKNGQGGTGRMLEIVAKLPEREESWHEDPHPASLSQTERELPSASERLPLPTGEGWGEGMKISASLSRGTIWTSPRIMQHSRFSHQSRQKQEVDIHHGHKSSQRAT
jgi:hypothetical protein